MGKTLSVFIDESGDFGVFDPHSPFYIVSLILHDQTIDISDSIRKFKQHLSDIGFQKHAIHSAPLVRKDVPEYKNMQREDRRKLFNSLFNLARKLPIHYISVTIPKQSSSNEIELTHKLTQELKKALINNSDYTDKFEKIIVYYDNGQVQLTKIITTIFGVLYDNVEMRRVLPSDYTLFQIADLICTVELTNVKSHTCGLSKSEEDFYMGQRSFQKNIYKYILKKHL